MIYQLGWSRLTGKSCGVVLPVMLIAQAVRLSKPLLAGKPLSTQFVHAVLTAHKKYFCR